MKNTILIISMFFLSFVSADGHLKSEQDVLASLEKYFEARNNNDYETVHLNASDDRGIDNIRTIIHKFATTSSLFNNKYKFQLLFWWIII